MFQVWPIANGIIQSSGESQPNTHHEAEHSMQEKKKSFLHMLIKFMEMAQNIPVQLS